MIEMKPVNIVASSIPDAWFQGIYNVLEKGFKYEIEQGSFVGQTRLEFDWFSCLITNPYAETPEGSYDAMLPVMPEGSTIIPPVDNGYVEQYMPYLMTGEMDEKEQYTYGSKINEHPYVKASISKEFNERGFKNVETFESVIIDQVSHFIELLKETPGTNQAILQVGEPADCLLPDPPCLRHIDMRVRKDENGKAHLIFYPYFRSWDLWGGFPANLAGIAVLQKQMADDIGVQSGPIMASSKGLHIYGYVEELAKIRKGNIETKSM